MPYSTSYKVTWLNTENNKKFSEKLIGKSCFQKLHNKLIFLKRNKPSIYDPKALTLIPTALKVYIYKRNSKNYIPSNIEPDKDLLVKYIDILNYHGFNLRLFEHKDQFTISRNMNHKEYLYEIFINYMIRYFYESGRDDNSIIKDTLEECNNDNFFNIFLRNYYLFIYKYTAAPGCFHILNDNYNYFHKINSVNKFISELKTSGSLELSAIIHNLPRIDKSRIITYSTKSIYTLSLEEQLKETEINYEELNKFYNE